MTLAQRHLFPGDLPKRWDARLQVPVRFSGFGLLSDFGLRTSDFTPYRTRGAIGLLRFPGQRNACRGKTGVVRFVSPHQAALRA
jgi:hypothetical protein